MVILKILDLTCASKGWRSFNLKKEKINIYVTMPFLSKDFKGKGKPPGWMALTPPSILDLIFFLYAYVRHVPLFRSFSYQFKTQFLKQIVIQTHIFLKQLTVPTWFIGIKNENMWAIILVAYMFSSMYSL